MGESSIWTPGNIEKQLKVSIKGGMVVMVDNKENIEVKRYQNISKTYRGYTLLSPVGGKEVYLID